MSGEFIKPELWRKAYVEHPLIRHLALLVVWDPVMRWNEEELRGRYNDVTLSSKARNEVKKRLAQRGVDVWVEDMARSY